MHQFYKTETRDKTKEQYPRFYQLGDRLFMTTGKTRAERRAEWSKKGRMNTRGQFTGGDASSGVYGSLLFDRYYSGRNMSKFPHWYGWSKKPGASETRDMAVIARKGR